MKNEIIAEIRNKLTVPRTALEKVSNGEVVPQRILELAIVELNALDHLIQKLESST